MWEFIPGQSLAGGPSDYTGFELEHGYYAADMSADARPGDRASPRFKIQPREPPANPGRCTMSLVTITRSVPWIWDRGPNSGAH